MKKIYNGIILAAMAGTLFASASFAAENSGSQDASVKCSGANACKGQSACKTATSSCKGQNSCKGQGYIMTNSAKECTDKGGKVEKS